MKQQKAMAAMLLATAGLALACGPTVLQPHLHAVATAGEIRANVHELKVHMKSGDLVVLDSWRVRQEGQVIEGKGTRYDVLRQVKGSGPQSLAASDIALLETNDRSTVSILATVGLSTLTAFWGFASIACTANPKSCFGSCPTFYLEDDLDRPRAEGFSASIARSLEARDVDALGDVTIRGSRLAIRMRNEAMETHAVRRVRLLSVPRPPGARVFATREGLFHEVSELRSPTSCQAPEGDCLAEVARPDDDERRSVTDARDLAAREEIDLLFPDAPTRGGIVIKARQSLLSTFLFYQTLAYMGRRAGDWLAMVDGGSPEQAKNVMGMSRVLGGIDVDVAEDGGEWQRFGTFDEAGPIAGDTQVVRLGTRSHEGPLRVRLLMAKGHWRIDWVALGELGVARDARALEPLLVERGGRPDASALASLRGRGNRLITLPGDEYRLTFALPAGAQASELFLESEGYYYEWMRQEWLAEEDPEMVALILSRPEEALRRLAGIFKTREAQADQAFWESRFRR
ncbi:MAG: hypothetical protein ACHQNV_03000 [Vicinamibacteria bacterium]